MNHRVVIEVTINSHTGADERVTRLAMQQGLPTPDGPIISQKTVKFASEGATLPEAAQDAVEAMVAWCNSEGAAILPVPGSNLLSLPSKKLGS